jgi:hypothetical protein
MNEGYEGKIFKGVDSIKLTQIIIDKVFHFRNAVG